MFCCATGVGVDDTAVIFHAHSVVVLKSFRTGAFGDHYDFALESDGDMMQTVELVGDPPGVWRTLLECIYKHFDYLYEDASGLHGFDEAASCLLKDKPVADLIS